MKSRQPLDDKERQIRQDYLLGLRVKLFLKHIYLEDVGRALNFSKSYVSHILAGRRHNERVIKYIEEMK